MTDRWFVRSAGIPVGETELGRDNVLMNMLQRVPPLFQYLKCISVDNEPVYIACEALGERWIDITDDVLY